MRHGFFHTFFDYKHVTLIILVIIYYLLFTIHYWQPPIWYFISFLYFLFNPPSFRLSPTGVATSNHEWLITCLTFFPLDYGGSWISQGYPGQQVRLINRCNLVERRERIRMILWDGGSPAGSEFYANKSLNVGPRRYRYSLVPYFFLDCSIFFSKFWFFSPPEMAKPCDPATSHQHQTREIYRLRERRVLDQKRKIDTKTASDIR